MATVIKIDYWRSVETSEELERREYKSGRTMYYVKQTYNKKWHRVETYWVEKHWLPEKFFVKHDEYLRLKHIEQEEVMLKVKLITAQKAGGFDYYQKREDARKKAQENHTEVDV